MKTTKLKLEDLKVKSFTTTLNDHKKNTLVGGVVIVGYKTYEDSHCKCSGTSCQHATCYEGDFTCGYW